MIVQVVYDKSGDRFEDVLRKSGGVLILDRQEAINEAEWSFNHEPSWLSVDLVECEGESEEDFYEYEERIGGYNPFWSLER